MSLNFLSQFSNLFTNFFLRRDYLLLFSFLLINIVSKNYLINLFLLLFLFLIYLVTLSLGEDSVAQDLDLKKKSIFYSSLIFFYSLLLVNNFSYTPNNFYFKWNLLLFEYYPFSLNFGLNGIGLSFVILTTFLIPLCLLVSIDTIAHSLKNFLFCIFLVEFLLVLAFSALDLFVFYLVFEGLLIPMFFLIGIWGSRERKAIASFYLFLYTLLGSLIMLSALIYIMFNYGRLDLPFLKFVVFSKAEQWYLFLAFFIGFAVKIPAYPFHLWLPEAHVEAPTAGSMILAGLLLKLGGFGFLRFVLLLFPLAIFELTSLVFIIAFLSILFSSFAAIRQTDLKRLIAYSSIAHMNLSLAGIFTITQEGIMGGIYSMWAHGVTSSALFALAGIVYSRYGTRVISYYGGLVKPMPFFSFFFFFFAISNFAFPGTSNFIGELLLFLGLIYKVKLMFFIPFLGAFLCLAYTILLFNRVTFGSLKTFHNNKFIDLTILELLTLSIFVVVSIFLGLVPNIFLYYINCDVIALLTEFETKLYINDVYSITTIKSNLQELVTFLRFYIFNI